jgi:hypothetical protein
MSELPFAVGLCPRPDHTQEFYVPVSEDDLRSVIGPACPDDCDEILAVYVRHLDPMVALVNVQAALKRDARLSVGWDTAKQRFGLFDSETRAFVIHAPEGRDISDVNFTALRGRLILVELGVLPE